MPVKLQIGNMVVDLMSDLGIGVKKTGNPEVEDSAISVSIVFKRLKFIVHGLKYPLSIGRPLSVTQRFFQEFLNSLDFYVVIIMGLSWKKKQ